jgi:hypothetical protein
MDFMHPLDVLGVAINVGDTVVRGIELNKSGSVALEVRKVSKVKDGKVWLDSSTTPVKFPERLAIVVPKAD